MTLNLYGRLEFGYNLISNGFRFSFCYRNNRKPVFRIVGDILDDLNELREECKLVPKPGSVIDNLEKGIRKMVESSNDLPVNWCISGGRIRTKKDLARVNRLAAILGI